MCGPAPTTSVNEASPIPQYLPCSRIVACSARSSLVADHLEGLVHRADVVAGVVDEPGRRLVRERVLGDEVLLADVGGVHAELVGRVLDEPLDQVGRLRDAERAAIGDTPGRLVRVVAVGHDVRGGHHVGAGHDVEQTNLELRGLRIGVERALVGLQRRAQAEHRAVVLQRELAVHVEVAREPGRDQVLGAILDPLHGVAEQQRRRRRDHVAGIHGHLVPEPAAEIRRDDPDVLLGQARDQREHRADRVGRLRGHVDRRPGRSPGRRRRCTHRSPAAPGASAGRRCRATRPCPRRRTPCRWRPCRRTPSGRCGCRSGLPSRRGSRARRRRRRLCGSITTPSGLVVDLDQVASVDARCTDRSRSPRRPPGPGTAPCRSRARPACRRTSSASRRGCAGPSARR